MSNFCSDGTLQDKKDAVSIQLGASKEVDVEVKDHTGREISFNDLDLQIALTPEQLLAAYAEQEEERKSIRSRVKRIVRGLDRSRSRGRARTLRNSKSVPYISNHPGEENVVYIR